MTRKEYLQEWKHTRWKYRFPIILHLFGIHDRDQDNWCHICGDDVLKRKNNKAFKRLVLIILFNAVFVIGSTIGHIHGLQYIITYLPAYIIFYIALYL